MTSARCPHCGKPDAPVELGCISRHRRADWDPDVDSSNEVCLASGLWLKVDERCGPLHPGPSEHCVDQQGSS